MLKDIDYSASTGLSGDYFARLGGDERARILREYYGSGVNV